jgi:regulatory protein YycH of two-component signal transduction system YycFG
VKEKIKTYFLALLVVCSILQSYYLAFGQPGFVTLPDSGETSTTWVGKQLEPARLIQPMQIIVHAAAGKHYRLTQEDATFKAILAKVSQRKFEGIGEVGYSEISWSTLRKQRLGFEIQYATGIPIRLLSQTLQIEGDFTTKFEFISEMWITEDGEGKTTAYFIVGRSNRVFKTTKFDFNYKELEQFVGTVVRAKKDDPYVWTKQKLYLPKNARNFATYSYQYEEFTSKQLQTGLFIDVSASRKLLDQANKEIYTDGKRGLKVDRNTKRFVFNDPISLPEDSTGLVKNLNSAVQFINTHGGWDGQYVLTEMPEDITQSYAFGLFIQGLPVYGAQFNPIETIIVSMKNGIVSNYDRDMTTLSPSTSVVQKSARLAGKDELLEKNKAYFSKTAVLAVYPAYFKTYGVGNTVTLTPKWVAKQANGKLHVLE